MRLITSIVALSMLLGCSSQHMSINSTNKSDLSKKTQEKTEAELDKESSIYPPIKDFPFEVKVVPVLDIDEEQTELTKNKSNYPKIGGGYNILVTNKINHEIQVLGPEIIFLPRIADKILAIKDFNGDGYLDIIAAAPAPMGSAYTSGTIYVYDPKFEKFSESKGIIQQGTIDTPLRGCISVQYPFSTRPDTEIMTDFYCWKNGKWKPVKIMKFITSIVALSILLGCSSQHTPINSTSKSDRSETTQEKTEAELDKESSIYPPIKDFPFEVKVIPVLYIDEEQTELTRDESYDPKISVGGGYNILVTNKINHDIQLLGWHSTELPRIADEILEIKDFNNDGFLDIKAMDSAPMGSRFLSSTIYLYNPEFKNFKEGEGITQAGELTVTKPGCIDIESPYPSVRETTINSYCWKNGKWKLIKSQKTYQS